MFIEESTWRDDHWPAQDIFEGRFGLPFHPVTNAGALKQTVHLFTPPDLYCVSPVHKMQARIQGKTLVIQLNGLLFIS